MKLPNELYDKTNDFQMQMDLFADLCEFMYLAKDLFHETKYGEGYSTAVMWHIRRETKRLEEMSAEIFEDIAKLKCWEGTV